jgi:hypothetical protein
MRSAVTAFFIFAAFFLSAGSGVCGDIYFEGWEGGTSAGWEATNPSSNINVDAAGGNPGGGLAIQGNSSELGQIGAMTMTPGATGDYWTSGVGLITFDMRFGDGWYSRVWLRIRSDENESSAWTYTIQIPNEPGDGWKQIAIELDQVWEDYDAQLAGWAKSPGAQSFRETMANVYAVEIVVLALETVDVRIDNFRLEPPPECIEELPTPVLVFKGKSATNNFKIKWDFEIKNWSDFSPELFLATPTLPPCGGNKAGPRTYVRFVSARGNVLAVICGVMTPEMLEYISFIAGDIGSPDVYVELIDRRCDIAVRSNVVSTVFSNEKPLARAGDDRTVECGGGTTAVTVDGSVSGDPDGDEITFEWLAQGVTFDDPTAAVTVGHFPMGTTHVVLKVYDKLTFATDVVAITVEDNTPPVLDISLNRYIVWPPNHKYFDIHATVTADDACGEVANIIFSKLFATGAADGAVEAESDWIRGLTPGVLATDFQILAERGGNEGERRYGLVYMALDRSLNLISDTVYVCVPHDRSGHALPSMGFTANGKALDEGAASFVIAVPSVREPDYQLDAGMIDISSAQVGNTKGVLSPLSVYAGDINGDGSRDMVFRFSASGLTRLRELADDKHEPVSFYFEDSSGGINAVLDIFDLGKPISISMGDLKLVGGEETIARREYPHLEKNPGSDVPSVAAIGRAYPNPFNPNVALDYALPANGDVKLLIYDVNGRIVRRLVSGEKPGGTHTAVWNARDDDGLRVSSGVYFVRLRFGSVVDTRKIVFLK